MKRKQVKNIAECYRRLITAIIQQAIKDNAVWFLKSPEGKNYCAVAGIDPAQQMGARV